MSYDSAPDNVTAGAPSRVALGRRLLHWLLPANCLACAAILDRTADSLGLCRPCRGRLDPAPRSLCTSCGRPVSAPLLPSGHRCGRCRRRSPAYDRLLWAWSYQPPLDAPIVALKFGRLEYLGRQIGEAVVQQLAVELTDLVRGPGETRAGGLDAVVPVPLHWRRRWRRGYDQARLIAEPVAEHLGLPLVPWLRRCRATPPQSRRDRNSRLRNLRDAFTCSRRHDCTGRRVLLVDDVLTTGATLEAAARCALGAGAASVAALVAARTPEPD